MQIFNQKEAIAFHSKGKFKVFFHRKKMMNKYIDQHCIPQLRVKLPHLRVYGLSTAQRIREKEGNKKNVKELESR